MMGARITIEQAPAEGYQITIPDEEGDVILALTLTDAEQISEGRFTDSEETALAVTQFLLDRQSAHDLPQMAELGDIVAAYEGAIDGIVGRLP